MTPTTLVLANKQLVRFVPALAVEHQVSKSETTVKFTANDWDLMHLKMLCVYCNNSHVQMILDKGRDLISLDGLLNIVDNSQIEFKYWFGL